MIKWEEDQEVLKLQKERIQALMEDNHRLMTMISALKMELRDVCSEFKSLSKSVKLLTSSTESLYNLLNERKFKKDKKGLSFTGKGSSSRDSSIVFVRASDNKNKS